MALGEFRRRTVPINIVVTIQMADQKKPIVSPILRDMYNSKRKKGNSISKSSRMQVCLTSLGLFYL
jgi:hypothetical protein